MTEAQPALKALSLTVTTEIGVVVAGTNAKLETVFVTVFVKIKAKESEKEH
ncbi:hypothetical protein FLGE108171_11775 [Flavobacterium gelidilacus]